MDDNKYFIIPFVLLAIFLLVLLFVYGNDSMFLFVNNHQSRFADFLFLNGTNLGDGVIAFILVVALLWVSFREALTFLLITLLITIIVAILKNYLFPEFNRPLAHFGSSETLRIIAGYDPPTLCTFPSGHAATAFSVYFYLSILSKNRITKFLLFVVAVLVCYSRVYISAHFPEDVVAGSLIAVIVTFWCYYWSRRIKSPGFDRKFVFESKFFAKQKTI